MCWIRWFEGRIYDAIKLPHDYEQIMLVPALVQFLRLENNPFLKLPRGGALNFDDAIKHIFWKR